MSEQALREGPETCWVPDCPRRTLIRDGAGWKWCWRHMLSHGFRPRKNWRLSVGR